MSATSLLWRVWEKRNRLLTEHDTHTPQTEVPTHELALSPQRQSAAAAPPPVTTLSLLTAVRRTPKPPHRIQHGQGKRCVPDSALASSTPRLGHVRADSH